MSNPQTPDIPANAKRVKLNHARLARNQKRQSHAPSTRVLPQYKIIGTLVSLSLLASSLYFLRLRILNQRPSFLSKTFQCCDESAFVVAGCEF
ncbi:hypothetical protein VNO80_13585 [Phaseolus coccineus]|uniref:Uncharacterized protein n=1 Tax=Phaseolus coccineus TaxID=3886 RepID=A0AAN9N396_PHACN